MPAKPIKAKEQYRLVMECRSSGLTDHQWCMEKGICPRVLFTAGCAGSARKDIRTYRSRSTASVQAQNKEIVRIGSDIPALTDASPTFWETVHPAFPVPAMELSVAGAVLRIPNGTELSLLREAIRLIGGGSC